jgi:hypothetical protein
MPDEPYRDAPPRRWPPRYGVTLVLTAVIAAAAGFLAVIAVRGPVRPPGRGQQRRAGRRLRAERQRHRRRQEG